MLFSAEFATGLENIDHPKASPEELRRKLGRIVRELLYKEEKK